MYLLKLYTNNKKLPPLSLITISFKTTTYTKNDITNTSHIHRKRVPLSKITHQREKVMSMSTVRPGMDGVPPSFSRG